MRIRWTFPPGHPRGIAGSEIAAANLNLKRGVIEVTLGIFVNEMPDDSVDAPYYDQVETYDINITGDDWQQILSLALSRAVVQGHVPADAVLKVVF